MFRSVTFCMLLLVFEETAHSTGIRREKTLRIPSKSVSYDNDNVSVDDFVEDTVEEELGNLPRIDNERLQRYASPQENRNKPKVMGFNNKSRMTTPFRHVDIMADLNEEVTEDSDESEGNDGDESEGDDGDESGGDDDSDNEDFEESSEEEILSDSMDEDNDKGKSNRRKDKKNKLKIRKNCEDDVDSNHSSDGVINVSNYFMFWFAVSILLCKLLLDISV